MPETVGGIRVGIKGEPLSKVLDSLSQYGITVHEATVSQWRSDSKPGTRIEYQIRAVTIFRDNHGFHKDYTYLAIAKSGVRLRRTGARYRKGCFVSDHYTEDIAAATKLGDQYVRRALRAMRAEIAFEPDQLDEDHKQIFNGVVGKFVEDMSKLPPSQFPVLLRRVNSAWTGNIAKFYRALYEQSGERSIGLWTPYEIPFLRYFYQDRIASGSNLSAFDKLILTSTFGPNPISSYVNNCRTKTGVDVDMSVFDTHRSFLMYGKQVSPFWSKQEKSGGPAPIQTEGLSRVRRPRSNQLSYDERHDVGLF